MFTCVSSCSLVFHWCSLVLARVYLCSLACSLVFTRVPSVWSLDKITGKPAKCTYGVQSGPKIQLYILRCTFCFRVDIMYLTCNFVHFNASFLKMTCNISSFYMLLFVFPEYLFDPTSKFLISSLILC